MQDASGSGRTALIRKAHGFAAGRNAELFTTLFLRVPDSMPGG